MLTSFQALYRQVTRRRLRIRACLAVACWLLLNAQLAVAAHHSATPQPVVENAMSMSDMSHAVHAAHSETLAQKPVCEKHCNPESAQPPSTSLQLNAIPVDSTLQLVVQTQALCESLSEWLAPPVTGPPAEIRFCRFRE